MKRACVGFLCLLLVTALPLGCAGDDRPAGVKALDGVDPASPEHPASFVLAMRAAVLERKPARFWDALPASYRADVEGLVHEFAGRADAALWAQAMGVARKLGRVLAEKEDLLVQHPMVAAYLAQVPEGRALIGVWARLLGLVADSELGDLDRLRTLDVAAFLDGPGAEIMGVVMEAAERVMATEAAAGFALTKSLDVQVLEREGDLALVEVSTAEGSMGSEVVERTEGCWLPRSFKDGWAASMAEARAAIATLEPDAENAAVGATLTKVDAALDRLLTAGNPAAFQAVLTEGLMQLAAPAAAPPGD